MCLIIHREYGSNVPNDVLSVNRTKNPDGFGISWRDEYGLHFEKFGPKDYEPFLALIKRIDRDPKIEYTAHYRYATTGAPCKELSHPFVYNDPDPAVGEVHIFHNGIINIHADKGESDTSQFVKDILANLPTRWWKNPAFVYLVEEAIGYSRLLVMTKDETVRLDGGHSWQKKNGIWYSTEPLPYSSGYKNTGSKWLPTSGKGDSNIVKYTPPKEWTKPEEVSSTDSRFEDEEPEDAVQTDVGWYHEGHWVEAVTEFDEDSTEDIAGEAICTECNTLGEFYIISGTTFIDVPHGNVKDDDDSDEDALLSPMDQATMARVYAN